MGYQELIASLKKEADENVRSIWGETDVEIQRLTEEASRRIKELKEDYAKTLERSIKEIQEKIISEARYKSRQIRLKVEHTLSERLFNLALSSTETLRENNYEEVFSMLVKELPEFKWKEIRVNPKDIDIARKYFPDAEIIQDETITGGFKAIRIDGRMSVINTFKKRLEKAWDEVMPLIIKDIYKEAFIDESTNHP